MVSRFVDNELLRIARRPPYDDLCVLIFACNSPTIWHGVKLIGAIHNSSLEIEFCMYSAKFAGLRFEHYSKFYVWWIYKRTKSVEKDCPQCMRNAFCCDPTKRDSHAHTPFGWIFMLAVLRWYRVPPYRFQYRFGIMSKLLGLCPKYTDLSSE